MLRIDVDNVSKPTSPGALRVYAREGDTRVKLIGDGTPVLDADRLAEIVWVPSIAVAQAMAGYCADLLKRSAGLGADDDGWHPLPVAKLGNLIGLARKHLHVTYAPAETTEGPVASWTRERCVHLGLRIGQGLTAKAIAEDPLIRTTANNVYQIANRFGVRLTEVPRNQVPVRLSLTTRATIERLAESAGLTMSAFLERAIANAARNPDAGLFGVR